MAILADSCSVSSVSLNRARKVRFDFSLFEGGNVCALLGLLINIFFLPSFLLCGLCTTADANLEHRQHSAEPSNESSFRFFMVRAWQRMWGPCIIN